MRISDDRLGEVLVRDDHARGLHVVNPVAHAVVEELSREQAAWRQEARGAAFLLLDELRANEPGGIRLGMRTAVAVLSEHEPEDDPELELRRLAASDPLLSISVDALIGFAGARRRPAAERRAVASVLLPLLRMFRAQEQADELRRTIEEEP